MRGFLPDQVIHKAKHGMGLPIARWLKEDKALNGLLEESLFSGSAELTRFIRMEYLLNLKKKFYSEESPYYGDNLWVFLILEGWLKNKASI
jgi:asparagine synthase (glutamine-hydrolysing)